MSTGAIVAIIVAALVIIAIVAFVLPRSRAQSRERQVRNRREEVAGAHREAADERMARADVAEREARRERAEAELHESRAQLHQEGLADDELDRDHERFVRGGETQSADRADTRADGR
jgi:Flp pilus assembly protein TadB